MGTTDDHSLKQFITRIDALIGILIEINRKNDNFSENVFAKILHSVGYTPTEIAKVFGKKKATDVAPLLYGKKKKKSK